MNIKTRRIAASAVALTLFLGACSSDSDGADKTDDQSTTVMDSTETTMADTGMSDEMDEKSDIVDTAIAAGDFTTLVAAVQAAGLEDTLRGDGPFTVFAPSDDAFATLPDGTVETLLEDPTGDLADILTYHVVEGDVMSTDLTDGMEVTTVNGATFSVNVADDGAVSITDAAGNEVGVVKADIETSNGVIHVLDGVLMPA
ncbi:MAG: fasciclin domain-containing protein [Aquihabitans sp.]